MTNETISKFDDVIDSRDVIARIEELTDERDAYNDPDNEDAPQNWSEDNPDDAEELIALVALAEEASGYAADWKHGETLIRDSYFKDYAMELAEDIGAIDRDAKWPHICIDWDQAARELQQDYSAVDFDGVTYWVR